MRGAFNDIHLGVDFWEPIDYSLIKVSLLSALIRSLTASQTAPFTALTPTCYLTATTAASW